MIGRRHLPTSGLRLKAALARLTMGGKLVDRTFCFANFEAVKDLPVPAAEDGAIA